MAEKHFDTATGTRASGAMWWALVIGVIAAIFLFTGVGAIIGAPLLLIAILFGLYAAFKRG